MTVIWVQIPTIGCLIFINLFPHTRQSQTSRVCICVCKTFTSGLKPASNLHKVYTWESQCMHSADICCMPAVYMQIGRVTVSGWARHFTMWRILFSLTWIISSTRFSCIFTCNGDSHAGLAVSKADIYMAIVCCTFSNPLVR